MSTYGKRCVASGVGVFLGLTIALIASPAGAAGDFPVSSCKGWNGTVTERDGIDTRRATMQGIVTKADVQEYCERDPGGETRAFGGKLTKAQCVAKYLPETTGIALSSRANCETGTVVYQYGNRPERRARFPLGPLVDASCAAGIPPLREQFKVLCPSAAKRFRVDE